jgi:CRISPR-associated endonuclease/helicase Cas3
MLEAIYADTPVGFAPALLARHLAASGSDLEERHQGLLARLPFRNGLLEDWFNAAETPDANNGEPRTRLIDSHTVVLAVVENGIPRLLGRNADGIGTVEASECRSPRRLGPLASEEPWVKALRASLDEKEVFQLKNNQIVFLTHQESDVWQSAPRPDWNGWQLRYCPERGFGPICK